MSEIEILKKCKPFASLEEKALARLKELSQIKPYEKDEWVFREHDAGEQLYVILKGKVKISKSISPEVEKILVVVGEGSIFGEIALIAPELRSATAQCIEESQLLEMGKDHFKKFTEEFPKEGASILETFAILLAGRLRITTESYKESILWGLEVSGASQMNFDTLIQENTPVCFSLNSGDKVEGKILKVDTSIGGCEITLLDSHDEIYVIPYNALSYYRVAKSELKIENLL